MVLYLSGPMTGIELHNRPLFMAAAAMYREQGHTVLNPHELSPVDGRTWESALRADLIMMLKHEDCRLVMLPGWKTSRGARLEHSVAKALGMTIYLYASDGTLRMHPTGRSDD